MTLINDCQDEDMTMDMSFAKAYAPARITTSPGRVACEVKAATAIPTKKVGGMIVVDTKISLTELAVMYDTDPTSKLQLKSGDKVYIQTGHLATAPWVKEVYEVEGKSFMLVPEDYVLLFKHDYGNRSL